MNIGVCVSFRMEIFSGYMPRSGITGGFPSLLRLNNIQFYIYTTFGLLTHPSINNWVASMSGLTWHNAAMNMCVQISLWNLGFFSFFFFWYMARSGIARSYSYSILNFLKNYYIVFHNSCLLCCYQSAKGSSFSISSTNHVSFISAAP